MDLSYQEVAAILKILRESQCSEFELTQGDLHMVFRRAVGGTSHSKKTVARDDPVEAPSDQKQRDEGYEPPSDAPDHWVAVTAPMVGRFFRKPAPDRPPFVQDGDEVKKGDAVGIIEVMKLMNTIVAEHSGIVRHIIEDDQLVQYGQRLLYLEPVAQEGVS